MASKACMQSFLSASHVLRQGLTILSSLQGEASTEQPTRRISGEHSPFKRPWMTLRRRYSAPDSASKRVRWPRMLGNMVLDIMYTWFLTAWFTSTCKTIKKKPKKNSTLWDRCVVTVFVGTDFLAKPCYLPRVFHIITIAQVQLCAFSCWSRVDVKKDKESKRGHTWFD